MKLMHGQFHPAELQPELLNELSLIHLSDQSFLKRRGTIFLYSLIDLFHELIDGLNAACDLTVGKSVLGCLLIIRILFYHNI